MCDFTSLAYLKAGNSRQQAAFRLLTGRRIFDYLSDFRPVLAGTVPIGIDIEGSDLDILCYVQDAAGFSALLRDKFSSFPGFELLETTADELPVIICRFVVDGFPVEVFGQNKPSTAQTAFRHLLIEHRILQEKGAGFRAKIIALKRQGIKTEPAFAQLLHLAGDPYVSLLGGIE